MPDYLRKFEERIDNHHKRSPLFSLEKNRALFYALTVFEDSCRLAGSEVLKKTGDSLEYSFLIREQLDSLNTLVQWIYNECTIESENFNETQVQPKLYLWAAKLLNFHAKPYSPICSAYISYSRGLFSAKVNKLTRRITFYDNPDNRNIFVSDMMETIVTDILSGSNTVDEVELQALSIANTKLISSISFKDNKIDYRIDTGIWNPFYNMMSRQWNRCSDLPEEWVFDRFSIKNYKQFWITTATFCFIHMMACLKSGVKGADVEEAVIIKPRSFFINLITDKTQVSAEEASSIIDYLTYNPKIRNNDIIYQPFVKMDASQLALSPNLSVSGKVFHDS